LTGTGYSIIHELWKERCVLERKEALEALVALGQETRLEVFRLLVRQGPIGMTAGAVAEALQVAPSTLSPHLAQLERSGLATSWRVDRRIFYAVNIEGMRRLLLYLTEECCGGHPELCADLWRSANFCGPKVAVEEE
jgi:ArsR family transcriptional regulator, arsenate/arsenite/antimonite-responsive transcriptional repressor